MVFRSYRQLVDRLELTLGDIGITVEQVTECASSSECPACGSDNVTREGNAFRCHECELDAHSDVVRAWNLLEAEVGPMARPAALAAERPRDAPNPGAYWEWNGYDWTPMNFGEQSSIVFSLVSSTRRRRLATTIPLLLARRG
ncbi:zinc ribbon domain-containing protein [Halobacterium sp. KA-6]|uniref:zinc ribbon domain-containing protein n=1 Tax=Halobacterium sp. KA-6 TaxID=2896368 RepID=UPI002E7C0A89|nr:zinc ribbon domain-containing protein [Halobacterium sp. KA-6]